MTDLHTLCRICHTRAPQYTCPRCALRTCSLACVQTHKRRAACSGLRDPTAYKPMRALATPAGVDHDYNFLSGIERGVARGEREIVEERGLVARRELREGGPVPGGDRGGRGGGGEKRGEGEVKIRKEAVRVGVRVEKLPVGMARQKANGTSWSKKQKCVVWQVEWVREAGEAAAGGEPVLETVRSKILATTPLLEAYTALLEEQRRAALTPEEKGREKKRRATEVAEGDAAKKTKLGDPPAGGVAAPDPRTSEVPDTQESATEQPQPQLEEQPQKDEQEPAAEQPTLAIPPLPAPPSPYAFYLHRPHTPVNQPLVLIPLRGELPLDAQLQGKVVVEFPTVYVFRAARRGRTLPEGFTGVDEFFRRRGVGRVREVEESETSSSGSSSEEEEEEEGEVAQGQLQGQSLAAALEEAAPGLERGVVEAAVEEMAAAAGGEVAHVE